ALRATTHQRRVTPGRGADPRGGYGGHAASRGGSLHPSPTCGFLVLDNAVDVDRGSPLGEDAHHQNREPGRRHAGQAAARAAPRTETAAGTVPAAVSVGRLV